MLIMLYYARFCTIKPTCFLLSILLIFIISNGSLIHIYIVLSQHNQVDGWGHVRLRNRINLGLIEILCEDL